jgi:hypothetical protein
MTAYKYEQKIGEDVPVADENRWLNPILTTLRPRAEIER